MGVSEVKHWFIEEVAELDRFAEMVVYRLAACRLFNYIE